MREEEGWKTVNMIQSMKIESIFNKNEQYTRKLINDIDILKKSEAHLAEQRTSELYRAL